MAVYESRVSLYVVSGLRSFKKFSFCFQGPFGGQDLVQEAIKQTAEMMEQIRNLYEAGASVSKEVDDGPVMKWHYCKCKNQFCQCCANIKIKPFGLNDQICVNAGYIPSELAVAVNVSWDGKVIISDKLSARNPPEVCAEVPIPKLEVSQIGVFELN